MAEIFGLFAMCQATERAAAAATGGHRQGNAIRGLWTRDVSWSATSVSRCFVRNARARMRG
jgi:hypothetical protein